MAEITTIIFIVLFVVQLVVNSNKNKKCADLSSEISAMRVDAQDRANEFRSLDAAYANEITASDKLHATIGHFNEQTADLLACHEVEIKEAREDAIKRSKAVTRGHTAETFIPFDDDFPYNPRDCKFFGNPIDYIVYDGMEKGHCDRIVFLEIKSGGSQTTKRQNQIKRAIEEGKVEFHTIRRLDNAEGA